MKNALSTVFLASALVAQQAAATYSWGAANSFKTPENCDNKCSDKQKGGYSWGDVSAGSFSDFDDFNFDGFTLQNSFKGKRDLTARTTDKCIVGKASKESDKANKPLSFTCGQRAFSIDTIDVSVEYDTDLEFLHTMEDGSTCKHVTSCSGRQTIKNTQCGGSKTVTVQIPKYGNDKPCNVGFHNIGFDCNPGKGKTTTKDVPPKTKTKTHKTKTTEIPSATTDVSPSETTEVTPPETTDVPPPETTEITPSESTEVPPETTPESTTVVSPTPSSNLSITLTTPTTPAVTPSTVVQTSVETVSSCAPEVPDCPGNSTPVETQPTATETQTPPAVTTVITVVTTSICPVTSTTVEGSSTIIQTSSTLSTLTLTTTSTICNKCTEAPDTTLVPTTSEAPSTTADSEGPGYTGTPGGGCPEVVPSCLNTWLSYLPDCKDNSDVSCFCPSSDFTDLLYSCVQAHGADEQEVQDALSYFAGICAAYVPENPGIVTACPSTITLTPPAQTVTVSEAAPPPVTTISVSVVVSSSTVTSAVTVPQVVFTTATVTPAYTGVAPSATTEAVGLVPGTAAPPTSNPAATVVASSFTGVTAPSPTTSLTPFEGAAVKVDSRLGVMAAAVIAGLALLA